MARVLSQPALFALKAIQKADAAKKQIPIEIQFKAAGLPSPETEFKFAKPLGRNWRLDYAWPELLIGFEIEGGTFGRMITVQQGFEHKKGGVHAPIEPGTRFRLGGRHNAAGFEKDIEKYNHASALGWCIIRATTRQIRDGEAINMLEYAFKLRRKGNVWAK